MARPNRSPEEEILLWCGVIAQLNRTRANQRLQHAALPYPLFVLLRHFCHDPDREWTISGLTAAFETQQPGMTKQVRKLLNLGLIEARVDDNDKRVRWLKVTAAGVTLRDELVNELVPDQQLIFRDWSSAEVASLHGHLKRLKTWLDDNRDTHSGDAER